MADEKGRWLESVEQLEKILSNILGDVLVSAGCVAYLGSFTVSILHSASSPVRLLLLSGFILQGRIQKYGLGGREWVGSRLLPLPSRPLIFPSLLSPSVRSRPLNPARGSGGAL